MIIGFSTGCLYNTHDSLDPATIDLFRRGGCNAIEIMIHRLPDIERFIKLKASDIKGFKYTSVHAPIYREGKKSEYIKAMKAIEKMHREVPFDAVVLHPDMFDDFSFLKDIGLPFAVENMDSRRESCKNVEDLQKVFTIFDVPMVFDINHSFTNDPTMELSDDLVKAFKPKIKELHISGFGTFHEPLFKTKQDMIISAVPNVDLPIIIESVLDSADEIDIELGYIKQHLTMGHL
ncbi:MAG: hypothetical protein NTV39_01480 [Candidatus Saccharibacteria bacterium]|nr:hypothetical protein [Candidatus Saccharibacteria bacterium]